MEWTEFATGDGGPRIAGFRAGEGRPVLLLHGGPSLGGEYLTDLADELAAENDVAWYQQRGLPPSSLDGPHSVATDVGDARRVLDALRWEQAFVVGHSWGGQLALHVAEAMPERLLGVLAVDPLGSTGDGYWPAFDEEIFRRTPEADRARARELDELTMSGGASEELALESMRLVWPAYFADPAAAPPMPQFRLATARTGEMVQSINEELPRLDAGLPAIRVPVGFVHGSGSPMPLAASTDAAGLIPGAWVEVVDGAGHFTWFEAPGAVAAALRRLAADAGGRNVNRRRRLLTSGSTPHVQEAAMATATPTELRNGVRGLTISPEDEGYNEARKVYNAMIDRRPRVIVAPPTTTTSTQPSTTRARTTCRFRSAAAGTAFRASAPPTTRSWSTSSTCSRSTSTRLRRPRVPKAARPGASSTTRRVRSGWRRPAV